jgi:Tol biopolymer transport system component
MNQSMKLGWGLVVFLLITIYGFNTNSIALAEESANSIPGKIIVYAESTIGSKVYESGFYSISFDKTVKGIKPIIKPYDNTFLPIRNKPELARKLVNARSQSLSPDSTRLLYILEKRKNKLQAPLSDIFVLDFKTDKTYQLTSTGYNVCPAWSPDGKKIAFYRGDESISCNDNFLPDTKGFALAIMNRNGTNLKEIVSGGYLFGIYRDYSPQWSPSGNDILFSYKASSTSFDIGIYLVHLDGSGLKLLKQNAGRETWSPDGKKIVMAVYYRREGSKIHVMDSTGANEKIIVSETKYNESPIWSPDGNWIAYIGSSPNKNNQLYLINLGNQKISNITPLRKQIRDALGKKWIP